MLVAVVAVEPGPEIEIATEAVLTVLILVVYFVPVSSVFVFAALSTADVAEVVTLVTVW